MWAAVAAAASALWTERTAHAQQTTFYLDRAQLSGAPDDGFVLLRPYLHEKTRFYGSAALGYTLNPLRANTLTDNPNVEERLENPVQHELIAYLNAGVEVSGRYAVGLSLPVSFILTGGADPQAEGVGTGLDRRNVAPHDLRLNGKVLVHTSDDKKLQIGVGGAVWFPTGNAQSFAGDEKVNAWLYGAGEYDFGKFQVVGFLGPHFRPDSGILGDEGVLEVGTELRYGFGGFLPMRQGQLRIGGTLWGTTGLVTGEVYGKNTFFNGRNTDLEWLGEVRILPIKNNPLFVNAGGGTRLSTGYGAPDIRILAMIGTWTSLADIGPGQVAQRRRSAPDVEMRDKDTDGDGYPDEIDLCPTEKEDGQKPRPSDGCPGAKDRDGDGIPDDVDKCPDTPEDKDGILDGDGCPETDADNDGVPDTEDACPLVPGEKNKDPKKNGCKKHDKIVETKSGIELLENIKFDTGRATIKPESFPILDEVVEVLKDRPEVRMGVYGHTDSRGSREMNTNLSKARAASVMNYLAGKGIERKRLESNGYGPDQPVDTNDTDEGRAKNRRVEFKILGE